MAKNTSSIPLKNYLKIRSQKPSNGLSIAGITLGVAVPFTTLFIAEDTLDVIPFCCLFMLIGSVLFLIGVSNHSKWDKQMKAAREQIEAEEKIPYPPTAQWPSIAATICFIGGFVRTDLEVIFSSSEEFRSDFFGNTVYQILNETKHYDAVINEMA